ncbi:HAMP domain-containing sensor histidine kinase [Paenibacillus caui]|uniref:HAMP domain-containing sensor histidine kinase n=1 Tax=Paenibacillus caui TaxID=2873927 RepID=UPI001CA7E6DB|nr:HAMP domain-containing sensor histidine kinase [Paenibacillus caui]
MERQIRGLTVMDLLINKDAKHFLIRLGLILLAGIIMMQIVVYLNTIHMKRVMIEHDDELAGYLTRTYPHLAEDIPSVFTADKSAKDLKAGRALLEASGYKSSLQMRLIPGIHSLYQTNVITNFIVGVVISALLLAVSFLFLKRHYNKIDRYQEDVQRIMKGAISTRLDDHEEGSLSKLAASINTMTASLHTHIEKEKQNRLFLKQLLTDVSHQLKTPLSAMAMYNEIMRDEHSDNEVIASFLQKSEGELERMHSLITNLLKLAKLDAGIIELKPSECKLNDLIRQAAESFEVRMAHEHKKLEIIAGGPVTYSCDKEWLLEAVSNLVKNAAEHTAAGNRIEIRLEEDPLMVRISVRDSGEGIHLDDINHIFKPFYRSRFSQNKQGTGIGLTLAKTIVDMHGGFISVESVIRKGTVFTVHLPKSINS